MSHKDRFFATIHHQPVDRPASWLGLPVPTAETALKIYFGVRSIGQLRKKIDDDIDPIEVPYNYPPPNHIACAFNFAKVSLICDRSVCSFYINDVYESGNRYLAGFRPECQKALSLQGAGDQVFVTFSVRTLRPTWPAIAKEPQRKEQA